MIVHQRYVVTKGDCLWDIAERLLGSPWEYERIFRYNNRSSIKQLTGRDIKDADLIYPNQVLYIPALPNVSPSKQRPKEKKQEKKPKSLQREIKKFMTPFATAFKLDDFPMAVYEDAFVRATIKLAGKIAIRLADAVPVLHATNRGVEATYVGKTQDIVNRLFFDEAKVEFDKKTNKISYRCMLVSNSSTPLAPSTAIGLAVSSDRQVPVLHGEIRFPKISGYIDRNFYIAENVRVVIEVEPKVPPVKNPDLVFKEKAVHQQNSGYAGAWKLVGDGALLLTATILTDFLFGIGIFDDVVTIPAALTLMGTGIMRLIYPVVVRNTITGAGGMALRAAH